MGKCPTLDFSSDNDLRVVRLLEPGEASCLVKLGSLGARRSAGVCLTFPPPASVCSKKQRERERETNVASTKCSVEKPLGFDSNKPCMTFGENYIQNRY